MMRLLVLCCLVATAAYGQSRYADSLRLHAQYGNVPQAMIALAECYEFGRAGVGRQPDSARYWQQRACDLGLAEGQYIVGVGHLRGSGWPRNIKKGLSLLDAAAAQQHKLALQALTQAYADSSDKQFLDNKDRTPFDLKKAFAYALRGAQLQDVRSIFYVGWAYRFGKGVAQNDSQAVHWLGLAAGTHRQVQAQLLLGDLYLYGSASIRPQHSVARRYYTLAAQNPYAIVEETTAGQVGLFYLEQLPRQLFNLQTRLTPFVPAGALDVRYKQ